MGTQPLFDFKPGASLEKWIVVNDGVMGGRSRGRLSLNEEGHGVFSGDISLANNGGFSSVRYLSGTVHLDGLGQVRLRVRGDGKRYQFRIKARQGDYYSYIAYFETNGQWQEIVLPLEDFYPSFRGNRLGLPNFPGQQLEEISILIGNKRAESFKLELDNIFLD
jgi:hypothetical protein